MSQFRFRLQTLLDFRVRHEDDEKRRLSELERVMQREQTALMELERGLREAAARYDETGQSDLDLERAQLFRAFYLRICSQIEDKQQVVSELREELETQRRRVVEAMRERKIVQSLHDRRFEEFRLDELRKEQAVLDDLATSRHVCGQLREDPETA